MTTEAANTEKVIQDYDGRPIVTYDILSLPGVQKLLRTGYHISTQSGKIEPVYKSKSHEVPWVYVRSDPRMNCTLWHQIQFDAIGIFPKDCLKCWKVVVRPRTVKELIQLLELQMEHTKRFCKCGIEVRDHVPALYGGYFYNHSKDEGLECLDAVRGLVSAHINPGVPVTLKRYCTEFELKFGPSDEVEQTLERGYFIDPERGQVKVMSQGDMEVWRDIASKSFNVYPENVQCHCCKYPSMNYQDIVVGASAPYATPASDCPECFGLGIIANKQPQIVIQHVVRGWYEYAYAHGDMTVKEFFGGEPLYTPSVTYERDTDKD